jgi:AcrR family transcriptional regulator
MPTIKKNTRKALLQAALELFAEKSFAGTSTALIAKRAGVASGTLFFHFKTKEELIHDLVQEVLTKIHMTVLTDYPEQMPIRERFIYAFSTLLKYFIINPAEFKLVEQYHFSTLSGAGCSEKSEHQTLKDILHEARAQRVIKDAPMLFLEAIVFGAISTLAKEHAIRGTTVDDHLIEFTIAACWDGLKI